MLFSLTAALALGTPTPETAAAHRFALVVAESDGAEDRLTLRYADDDARAVHRTLTELGGVAVDDAALVLEPGHRGFEAALHTTARRLADARARGERTELVVYYSGHSDEAGLLLRGERLSYADLRRAVDAMAADLRVVILDSCAAGELTRTKGVVRRPAFLSEADQVRGHVFLTASSAEESAQESDTIGASFFTHFLVAGLRGAADSSGDLRVSLTEAYEFAFHETLARTERTTLGSQHPSYAMNLTGTGDVVLTDLARADATLVLPDESSGRYFVRDQEGRLFAELRKIAGRATELALPVGEWSVLIERDSARLQGAATLSMGARVTLDESTLVPVQGEPAIPRGPPPEELARRAAERERKATLSYEREKLRVEPATGLFEEHPFNAFAGDVAVPVPLGDFFDRAGRPDLVERYEQNLVTATWLQLAGVGTELLVGLGATLVALAFPLPTGLFLATVGTGVLGTLGGASLALGATFFEPTPVTLDEARAIAQAHNEQLRARLNLRRRDGGAR